VSRLKWVPKDFFISYSNLDEDWAEWISWEIEAAGYTVMMQKWDFTPGKNFAIEMNNAVNYAGKIILILSKNFLLSDFTKPEWASFFSRDPTGNKRMIIPVRVEECQPNGLLQQIVYIDFVGKSQNQCRDRLLTGIQLDRNKPVTRPLFPGTRISINEISPKFPESVCEPLDASELSELVRKILLYDAEKNVAPLIENRQLGRAFIREVFDEVIADYIQTNKTQLSLIILDVDGMGGINKAYGVEVGDEVINHIGFWTLSVKHRLLSGRFGDDTFFVVLRQVGISDTETIANEMIKSIREFNWASLANGLYVLCSAGVAQFSLSESANSTVTRAVQGQRFARSSGGNKVVRGPRYVEKGNERGWTKLDS
jgi:diguanylate cyclase (GGDEF)-like protein